MSLAEVIAAIAEQLDDELGSVVDGVQIEPGYVLNPTPPCLDIYPADPFLAQSGFGAHEAVFVVRARVSTADSEAGQGLLLDFLDPSSESSVRAALRSDPTLGGAVDDSGLEDGGPEASGFIEYVQENGRLLGCEWRLRVVLS